MKALFAGLSIFLFSLQLFAASPIPSGSWEKHGLNDKQGEQIRAAFQKGIDNKFIPGGSLMLIHKGEIILNEGFGVADLESQKPFEVDAPCRIASLTKPHTTTTLALLAEKGKLSFSDPLSKYIPAFKKLKVRGEDGYANPITLAMCLSHTAGFASNNQLKAGKLTLNWNGSLEEVVNELASHDLFYEPATAYGYGRLGYMAAARVAEIVTGKPFEEVMADELFATIGSKESTFDYESVIDQIPTPYMRTKSGFVERTGEPMGTVINPGGSLIATSDNVARMLLLHRNRGQVDGKQVVSETILKQMYQSQHGRGKAKYGFGFNILAQRSDGSTSRIQHTGAAGTIGIIDFDLDLIVIALTQVPQAQTNKWRGPMLKTVFEIFQDLE
ncbi:MAG: serine hydrolase [Opitutales bacterium]|jgi:CubicO group peptidase (beta-lactamase class C family)|nr:serine hydrolase [Opitutales bacterium]